MATENQHKPNDFTPVIGAMNLAGYVFKITDNINKFPDFCIKEKKNEDGTITQIYVFREDSLTNTVRAEAREIFHLAYSANEINLNRQPWRKGRTAGKAGQGHRSVWRSSGGHSALPEPFPLVLKADQTLGWNG